MSRAWTAAALLACTGCAGARTQIVAPTASVPISLSHAVRDWDGSLVPDDRREVVGVYHDERMAWGTLYSAVKLTPTKDISDEVNAQVAKAGGDAIVKLRIESRGCPLTYFVILNAIPIWPGCAKVTLDGEIVRVKRDAPSASPVAARSTP